MLSFRKAICLGLFLGLLGLVAQGVSHHFGIEEKVGLYLLFRTRGETPPPPVVAVAAMDRRSGRKLSLPRGIYKWPRSLHARLVARLTDAGAAAVAFDVIFDEPREADEDGLFAASLATAGNVVLCEHVQKETVSAGWQTRSEAPTACIERRTPPIALLAGAAVDAAPFPLPKRPVRVGQVWLFKPGAGDVPTLPVVAFQLWALCAYDDFRALLVALRPDTADTLPPSGDELIRRPGIRSFASRMRLLFQQDKGLAAAFRRRLAAKDISPRHKGVIHSLVALYAGPESHYLNFYGPAGTIATASYCDFIDGPLPGTAADVVPNVQGKAVFVGLSDPGQVQENDVFFTVFSQANGVDLSGVEIAATAFANLAEDHWIRPLGGIAEALLAFLWGLSLTIACVMVRPRHTGILVLCAWCVFGAAALGLFMRYQIWLPLVVPLFFQVPAAFLIFLCFHYRQVKKEQRNIHRAFGHYLPAPVVNRLASDLGAIGRANHLVFGVCLFTDAEQYTPLGETMDPVALRDLMNRYYGVLFPAVTGRGGIISDVVGDAMLALWTAAAPDNNNTKAACLAALEISAAIDRFKDHQGTAHLPTRIGIHAGFISLGDVGARGHFEYRAMGDIVNTASRIEGLNKRLGTRILITEAVADTLDQGPEGFLFRPLGAFLLPGKTREVALYELMTTAADATVQQRLLCEAFTAAMGARENHQDDKTIKYLLKSLTIDRKDGPALFYLEQMEAAL